MKIPVFHDDQHGTAIIGARPPSATRFCCKARRWKTIKPRHVRAPARRRLRVWTCWWPWACRRDNIVTLTDIKGVVYARPPGC